MTCKRADQNLAPLFADVGELGEVVDVDQQLGLREAQLHHRQQAVAAGDDPGVRADALERGDRALEARRALVVKRRWSLHSASPPSWQSACGRRATRSARTAPARR